MVVRVFFLLALCSFSVSARAGIYHDPGLNWFTLETEHFYLHFHDGAESLTRQFAVTTERAHKEITAFLNWTPSAKTHVVLTDEYDVSNGTATVFPRNTIILYISAPDYHNSLEDHLGWLDSVFVHEYLHIVHLDKNHSLPAYLQTVFGRHFLLFPNTMQPKWVIEGLATYAETDTVRGTGRGQSSYYNMLMRMEVASGIKPLRQVNQQISSWPMGQVPYLYGVNYFNFIRDRYGEERIQQQVEDLSANLIPFRIMNNVQHVYAKDIDSLWAEFTHYLEDKHRKVLAEIEAGGVREGVRLTHQGYFLGPLRSDGEALYYSAYDAASHAAIYRLDTQQAPQRIAAVQMPTRLDLHSGEDILLMQPELCRNTNLYYDLYTLNKRTGKRQRLSHCGRYRYAVWSANGEAIFAVHNELGRNTLVRLNRQGQAMQTLWRGEQGEQIGYLSRAPQGDRLALSIWRPGSGWDLAIFETGDASLHYLSADAAIQQYPVFSQNGQSLLFSADYDGRYNIYRLDLATGKLLQLTNVRGGAFYPQMHQGKLYYAGYSADGFDLYRMDSLDPLAVDYALAPVDTAGRQDAVADTAAPPEQAGPVLAYSAAQSLGFTWWSPFISLSDYRSEYGFSSFASDVLQRHMLNTTLIYDVANQQWLGDLSYQYDGWYPSFSIGLHRSNRLGVDGGGSVTRIRNDDNAIMQLSFPYRSMDANSSVTLAALNIHSYDAFLATAIPPLADTHNDVIGLAWRYNSTKKYPRSISREEGRELRLIYENSDLIGSSDNRGQIYLADWREFIGLGHNRVLALRLVEGRGENNSTSFQLGGIQNTSSIIDAILGNVVNEPLFFVRNYSLRGYGEGKAALNGKNMRLLSTEYRFPLWSVERGWMAPPVGLDRMYGSVFYDVGGVWDSGVSADKYFAGIGIELNADMEFFYSNRMQLNLGYAQGLDEVEGGSQVYLRFGVIF